MLKLPIEVEGPPPAATPRPDEAHPNSNVVTPNTRSSRNGAGSHFGWDALERCVHCWSDGGVCDRKLSYLEGATRVRDSLGRESVYHHDNALVDRSVDAYGEVRQVTRGAGRRIEGERDELGQCVRKRYDARGNLIELCAADGASWRFEYDRRDRLLQAVDFEAFLPLLASAYCPDKGRPPLDPVVLLKFEVLARHYRYSDREVMAALIAHPPARFIYVACGLPAFLTQASELLEHGFRLERLSAFGLFPFTEHVEVLASFAPAS